MIMVLVPVVQRMERAIQRINTTETKYFKYTVKCMRDVQELDLRLFIAKEAHWTLRIISGMSHLLSFFFLQNE